MIDEHVTSKGNHRVAMLPGAVLLVGLLVVSVVACEKSPNEPKTQTSAAAPAGSTDPHEQWLAFAGCMREQGLKNFPDPVDRGIDLRGTGLEPSSPEFQAAEKACSALLPPPREHAGPGPGGPGPESERRAGGGEVRRGAPRVNTEWTKVVPGGDCACADGSEYFFWDRKKDPAKVVLYLDGGGVCFDALSCTFQNTPGSGEREGPDYDPNLDGEYPGGEGGLFDFDHADNPFSSYSFIYVPLCTADAFIGNITREYSPTLTVHHKGFVNGSAALDYLTKQYSAATQVVVLGKSAGSSAAPLYAGLISDRLPTTQITVFGAQSGAFPNDPDLNAKIGELWGAFATMPAWEVNKGLTAREWGNRGFWIQAGLHNPKIVMAHFDYAFDSHAVQTLEYLKVNGVDPSNTLGLIDANEAAIEAAGVNLHSYLAPGDGHGIFEFEKFYTLEVNGVRLIDWIKALVDGTPLDDVHCDPCK